MCEFLEITRDSPEGSPAMERLNCHRQGAARRRDKRLLEAVSLLAEWPQAVLLYLVCSKSKGSALPIKPTADYLLPHCIHRRSHFFFLSLINRVTDAQVKKKEIGQDPYYENPGHCCLSPSSLVSRF